MNKRLALFAVSFLAFYGLVAPLKTNFAKVVLIDVEKLMMETREGRTMIATNQKGKEEVMKVQLEKSKEIGEMRSKIEEAMRGGKMSQIELQIESEKLARKQREAKYLIECKQEDLMVDARKREFVFKTKILAAAKEYFGKEGGVAVLNKNSAGVIYASDEADRTAELKVAMNSIFEKERLTLAMTKNGRGKKAA